MVKAKQAGRKGGSSEPLYVGSKVKAAIKAAGCNPAGDGLDGINLWLSRLIQQATAPAKANGRKIVRAHDFMIM
jgi:hypothetical protein